MVREHGISFTEKEWTLITAFSNELGFSNNKGLVKSAIIEYTNDRIALIQRIKELYGEDQ